MLGAIRSIYAGATGLNIARASALAVTAMGIERMVQQHAIGKKPSLYPDLNRRWALKVLSTLAAMGLVNHLGVGKKLLHTGLGVLCVMDVLHEAHLYEASSSKSAVHRALLRIGMDTREICDKNNTWANLSSCVHTGAFVFSTISLGLSARQWVMGALAGRIGRGIGFFAFLTPLLIAAHTHSGVIKLDATKQRISIKPVT